VKNVRNHGCTARSNHGYAAWVKNTRHPTRRSCKLSTSETYNQCNHYGTTTRRTVAAQYSADAASLGLSVKTQRTSPTYTADIAAHFVEFDPFPWPKLIFREYAHFQFFNANILRNYQNAMLNVNLTV